MREIIIPSMALSNDPRAHVEQITSRGVSWSIYNSNLCTGDNK